MMDNPFESPRAPSEPVHDTGAARAPNARGVLSAVSFAAAFVVSASIWLFAAQLTGHHEPWDGIWPIYHLWLFGGTMLAVLVQPRRPWWALLGTYVGKVVSLLLQGPDYPPWVALLVILLLSTWRAVPGASAGYLIGWVVPWRRFC